MSQDYYLYTVGTPNWVSIYLYPMRLISKDFLEDLESGRYLYCGGSLEPTEDGKFIDLDCDEVFTHSGFNEDELIIVDIETNLNNINIVRHSHHSLG